MVGDRRRWLHIFAICPEIDAAAIIVLPIETSWAEKLKQAPVRSPLPPNSARCRRMGSEATSHVPTATPQTHRCACLKGRGGLFQKGSKG